MTAYESNACGHEKAPDEPAVCLVLDVFGRKHRVQRFGVHCTCHGHHVLGPAFIRRNLKETA
jgi:hypothetical protein